MNPPLESRPLRQFVAVAEELNFARAAERLTISAPALSRTIARLETQLGVKLFERSTRRVALTAAGEALLDGARPALRALDAAAARAQRAGQPERPLVLAVKADLDGGLLDDAVAAYARDPDGGELDLRFGGWGEQVELVVSGEADAALVFRAMERLEDTELDSEPLVEEPQVAVLPADHPLAGRAALALSDLEAEYEPIPHSGLWRPRETAGERPRITDMSQLLRRVERGEMIAVVPASVASRFGRPQVAYRPVRDAPPAVISVTWPRHAASPATAAFVRVIADVAAAMPTSARPPRSARASRAASAASPAA